jgi:hypothetical protein
MLGALLGWVVEPVEAGPRERTTGSTWGKVFEDPPDTDHFGVGFRGSNGADPNFTGNGGNEATNWYDGGIKNWDWWGTNLGTLLTPKRFIEWCTGCEDRKDPRKYNTIITRS